MLRASCRYFITTFFKSQSFKMSSISDQQLKRSAPCSNTDADKLIVPHEKKAKLAKRKKVALLTVYSGKGYHGVQIQSSGIPTIEGELLKALGKHGLIDEPHINDLKQLWFQRASRTDKGVSAAGQVNESLPASIKVLGIKKTTKGFDAKHNCSYRTYEYLLPTFAFASTDELTTESYKISETTLQSVNDVLQEFKGTHNFYNFTSRRDANDKSTMRYMMSLEAGQPFINDGIEYLTITIRGQSFMLHQIRKMIGLTISVVRGLVSRSEIFNLCWAPQRVDIPKAPGLGLLLDKLHFDGYNKKFGHDGIHEPLEWSEYEEQIKKFKMDQIYSDIMQTEKEERSMLQWLSTLIIHTFQVTMDNTDDKSCAEKLSRASEGQENRLEGEGTKKSVDEGVDKSVDEGACSNVTDDGGAAFK